MCIVSVRSSAISTSGGTHEGPPPLPVPVTPVPTVIGSLSPPAPPWPVPVLDVVVAAPPAPVVVLVVVAVPEEHASTTRGVDATRASRREGLIMA